MIKGGRKVFLLCLVLASIFMPTSSYRCLLSVLFGNFSGQRKPKDHGIVQLQDVQERNKLQPTTPGWCANHMSILHDIQQQLHIIGSTNDILVRLLNELQYMNQLEETWLKDTFGRHQSVIAIALSVGCLMIIFLLWRNGTNRALKDKVKTEVREQLENILNILVQKNNDKFDEKVFAERLKTVINNQQCVQPIPSHLALVQMAPKTVSIPSTAENNSQPLQLDTVQEIFYYLQQIASQPIDSEYLADASYLENRDNILTPKFIENLAVHVHNEPSLKKDIQHFTPEVLLNVAGFYRSIDEKIRMISGLEKKTDFEVNFTVTFDDNLDVPEDFTP